MSNKRVWVKLSRFTEGWRDKVHMKLANRKFRRANKQGKEPIEIIAKQPGYRY